MTDLTLQMRIKAEAAQARREVKAAAADTRGLGDATKDVGKAGKTASAQIKQAAAEQSAAVKAASAKSGDALKSLKQHAAAAGEAIKRGMREGAREEERVIRTTSTLGERIRGMLRRVGDAGGVFHLLGRTATSEIGRIGHALGSMQGRLGALGLGVGIGAQIKSTAVRQTDYVRMAQTAELSPVERDAMRATNWKLAGQYGIDEGSLREASNTLLAKGLKLSAVNAMMEAIARTSAVTGAAPSTLADVGATAGNTFGINIDDPRAVTRMFDQMVVATRAGGMEMEDLSSTIPNIAKQARPMDLDFPRALAFMEAMSSVVPDKARAATAVESGLRIFTNDAYRQQIADGSGIAHLFFDENKKRRAPEYTLGKLSEAYSRLTTDAARAQWISKVTKGMDNDTTAWLTANMDPKMLALFKDIYAKQQGAQAVVSGSLAENLNSATGVAGRLKGTFGAAFDRMATPINKVLADAGNKLLDTGMSGEQMLGAGAGAAGAAYLAGRLGGPLARKLSGLVGGGADTIKNLAVGKALHDATGVMPVFVTNWAGAPGGIGGGAGIAATDAAALGTAARDGGKLARVARYAGWGAIAYGGMELIDAAFAPVRAAQDKKLEASERDAQRKLTGLSDAELDRKKELELKDMPYGKWTDLPQNRGKYGLFNPGFDDYQSWLIQQSRMDAPSVPGGTDAAQQMQDAAALIDSARRALDALIGKPLQIVVTSDTPEFHARLNDRHERDARRG